MHLVRAGQIQGRHDRTIGAIASYSGLNNLWARFFVIALHIEFFEMRQDLQVKTAP